MLVTRFARLGIERRRNHKPKSIAEGLCIAVALYPSAGRRAGLTGMALPSVSSPLLRFSVSIRFLRNLRLQPTIILTAGAQVQGSTTVSGSRTRIVVPSPVRLSTVSVAPCAMTRFRAMVNPSPDPPVSRPL